MRDLSTLATRLTQIGRAAGLDAIGFAPASPFEHTKRTLEQRKVEGLSGGMQFTYRNPTRSTDPQRVLAGARTLVVGARSYRRAEPESSVPGTGVRGEVARYSWIDHYAPLRASLAAVADTLTEAGWRATVLADDNALVDREAAFRAGLGWYGKNTMLLLHGHGSEFVLGSVVTDAHLPTSAAPTGGPEAAAVDGCGPCTRCLPACPTGALVAPGVLDARRCLAWLLQAEGVFPREHRQALGGRMYGCDECQDACPPNRLEIRRRPPPSAEVDAESVVDLLALLEEPDDDVLLDRHGRWYVPRRDARYLRRNALVALGNVADGGDGRVAAVVRRFAAADDTLLRAHAAWAASRLGLEDVVIGLERCEREPVVLAELGALPGPRTK